MSEYFFGDGSRNRNEWVRARGWGDDGKSLCLPGDTRYILGEEVGGIFYSLYHSSEKRRWFVITYDEARQQWYGYSLYVDSDCGGRRLSRTKREAMEAWNEHLYELKNLR